MCNNEVADNQTAFASLKKVTIGKKVFKGVNFSKNGTKAIVPQKVKNKYKDMLRKASK